MRMNLPPQPKRDVDSWMQAQGPDGAPVALSIVVPAFNEERRLTPTLIDMIDFLDGRPGGYEIIVVDDGSTDATSEVVKKFERIRSQVRLLRLAKNAGKGHAVRVGMLNAHGERVLFADADGATPIGEIARLSAALDGGADAAIGSRALRSDGTRVSTVWYRRLLGRIFNTTVNLVLLPRIADTQCGFKMFRAGTAAEIFQRQTADGFSFDVEILYLARKLGFSIAEVPINWTNIPGSKVNLVVDSTRMLLDIFIFRVRHRHVAPRSLAAKSHP